MVTGANDTILQYYFKNDGNVTCRIKIYTHLHAPDSDLIFARIWTPTLDVWHDSVQAGWLSLKTIEAMAAHWNFNMSFEEHSMLVSAACRKNELLNYYPFNIEKKA